MKIPNLTKNQSIALLLLIIILALPEIYLFVPYFLVIKPEGERNINAILSELKTINQTDKKLERIAEWEADGFTGVFNEEPDVKLPGVLLWTGAGYGLYLNNSDKQPIKIRASSLSFANDPYWIAYFKTGACEERAKLFNYISNQSGEVSRVVKAPGNDHAWVEVYNGTDWIYADPTFYFHYHNSPDIEKFWMNETPMLQEGWGWHLSKVTTEVNDTELTDKYTQVRNLTIVFNSTRKVTVNQFIQGENRNVTLFSNYTKESPYPDILVYQLGQSNNYTVIAEKNNNYFFKRIDEKFIRLDNESLQVDMDPNYGREEIDYLAIVVIAFVLLVWSFFAYQGYKKGREKNRDEKHLKI